LGDPLHEEEVLRPGQDELARPVGPVHDPLDVGEQVGRSLGLVQYGGLLLESAQEAAGVFRGEGPLVGVFQ
jgi:hypothetical protein